MDSRRIYSLLLICILATVGSVACIPSNEPAPTPTIEPSEPPPTATISPTATATAEPTETPTEEVVATPVTPAVPSTCPGDSIVYYVSEGMGSPNDGIYRICLDDLSSYRISEFKNFIVSPGGRYLAYLTEDDLTFTDLSGQRLAPPLTAQGTYISPSAWSPDGDYISYVEWGSKEDIDDISFIKVRHVSTNTVSEDFISFNNYLRYTEITIGFQDPAWSPTGDRILLFKFDMSALLVTNVSCDAASHVCEAATVEPIPTSPYQILSGGAWSADGESILAKCARFPPADPEEYDIAGICIFDINGNLLREFKETELGVSNIIYLGWAPDNKSIVFNGIGDNTTSWDIYVLNLDDGSIFNVTKSSGQSEWFPIWLPEID